MQTIFVLLDFENVQPPNLALLQSGHFQVKVFVGSNQKRIPLQVASALQALGKSVEYVQIQGAGINALDFHIAYYLGRLTVAYPKARFYIVSKDTGFDILIAHLKTKNVACARCATVTDIPLMPGGQPVATSCEAVIVDLVKRKTARPRTLKTLTAALKARFTQSEGDGHLGAIVSELASRGIISEVQGKLTYNLPLIA